MAKKRVHEIAKAHGLPSKTVLDALQKDGHDIATASSSVDEGVANRLIEAKGAELKSAAKSDGGTTPAPAKAPKTTGATAPADNAGGDAPARPQSAPARPVRP
ncbi:translation initiation factor IF-2 N-terminal domain-containing protein, partial [Patulibacter sp. S7RM1-6]